MVNRIANYVQTGKGNIHYPVLLGYFFMILLMIAVPIAIIVFVVMYFAKSPPGTDKKPIQPL